MKEKHEKQAAAIKVAQHDFLNSFNAKFHSFAGLYSDNMKDCEADIANCIENTLTTTREVIEVEKIGMESLNGDFENDYEVMKKYGSEYEEINQNAQSVRIIFT